jgi:hypothetical protein
MVAEVPLPGMRRSGPQAPPGLVTVVGQDTTSHQLEMPQHVPVQESKKKYARRRDTGRSLRQAWSLRIEGGGSA